jgi:glucan phosphoethanolaminetransferase (alkaline phosphatase superfamily)
MVMRGRQVAMVLAIFALISIIVAMIVVRVPSLWPLIPEWLGNALANLFDTKSQERAADIEFFSAWLLSFVVLVLALAATVFTRRPPIVSDKDR